MIDINPKAGASGVLKSMIQHSKIVYLAVVVICALGIVGLVRINKDEFPTFDLTQGLVAAVYPGAQAEEVEQQLAKPLEEILLAIPEVRRENLQSVSKDGICYIYVDLNCHQSRKTEVWSKIKHILAQKKITLPAGVLTVQVLDDFSEITAIMLALESPDKGWSEMKEYADDLKERLRKIPRLASVTVLGTQQEEIAVTLDMERLSAYGLSPASLMLGYTLSSLNIPSGTFETDYTSAPIIVDASLSSEAEIAKKIVYCDPAGNIIRLEDIATIERRMKEPTSETFYNGGACVVLSLVMRPDNNIVAFGHDVDEVMEEFKAVLPPSVSVNYISDQPKVVDRSVMGFLRDLLISMLVVIFVMIMMFPMRSALIASSGVPVCTIITIAVMYLTGMTLNTVTLAALIVVLGMIVDDSIITMDGYMDKLSKGMTPLGGAVSSAKSLFMSMFMATLSICSMFFPMLGIISGYLGDFIQSFPWIILIALMTSLLYAVCVVPSLEIKYITAEVNQKNNFTARLQHGLFTALQKAYDRVQVKAFRHPRLTIGIGVLAVGLGVLMFSRLNVQMMPMAARRHFAVEINMDPGCNMSDTRAVADSLGKLLLCDPMVESVTSFVGTGAPRYHTTYAPKTPSPTFAQLIVNTASEIATEQILPHLEAKYEHYFPRALVRIKQMDYQGTTAPVAVNISGPDRKEFMWVVDSLENFMRTLDHELKWVHRGSGEYVNCVKVEVDPQEASRLGVDKALVGLSLNGSFAGSTLLTMYEGQTAIPVNMYNSSVCDAMDYDAVGSLMIPTYTPSVSIPLRQVASITPDWRPATLMRMYGEEYVSVEADLKYGISNPKVMKKIKAYVNKLEHSLPEQVKINYGGLAATNSSVGPEIALSFLAAIAIMFFFLLLHFKKISLAALSMVLSLLCLFGASFALWAFNQDFGMTSVLGIVSLIGIIVRNGIIMFDYAEELIQQKGMSVKEAAMLAGQRRMRPIFLTSCTTALGVLPMIISGDTLWQPMGLVICFGIMFSILLIVFVMPVSYWLVFDTTSTKPIINETN